MYITAVLTSGQWESLDFKKFRFGAKNDYDQPWVLETGFVEDTLLSNHGNGGKQESQVSNV